MGHACDELQSGKKLAFYTKLENFMGNFILLKMENLYLLHVEKQKASYLCKTTSKVFKYPHKNICSHLKNIPTMNVYQW